MGWGGTRWIVVVLQEGRQGMACCRWDASGSKQLGRSEKMACGAFAAERGCGGGSGQLVV